MLKLFFILIFLVSCGDPEHLLIPVVPEPVLSESTSPVPSQNADPITLASLEFQTASLTLTTGQIAKPNLHALLSNGSTYKNLGAYLITPYKKATHPVLWFTNDNTIANVSDDGILTAKAPGTTSIKVNVGKQAATLNVTVTPPEVIPPPEPPQLIGMAIFQNYRFISNPAPHQLTLTAQFDNGKVSRNLSAAEFEQLTGCPVYFLSSRDPVATLSEDGWLTPLANGQVTLMASCDNLYADLSVEVRGFAVPSEPSPPTEPTPPPAPDTPDLPEPEPDPTPVPEAPLDPSESFLNLNDVFTLSVGSDGGFNSQNLPDIILGPPVASRADVLSLGNGGQILIELNSYVIVNGAGKDFVIFENPFSGWSERAQVSVSEDGQAFFDFDCDAFDPAQVYAGCAGVTPVQYSANPDDYLDSDISGGDGFDLNDVGLDVVRFIKITDMATCTSPALCGFGKAGFDLDAMAIVNGVNE